MKTNIERLLANIDDGLAELRAAWLKADRKSRAKWMTHINKQLDQRLDIMAIRDAHLLAV